MCLLCALDAFCASPPCNVTLSAVVTDETCPGFYDGAIDLVVTGATGNVSYTWSTGDLVEDIASITSGTYSVTILDANGCVASGSYTVTDAHGLTVSLGNDTSLCNITNYLLTPVTSGATFYYWQDGSQSTTFLANSPGIYDVYVQNSFGCFATDTVELLEFPVAVASLAYTQPGCGTQLGGLDLSPSGGQPPYTYHWSNGLATQDNTPIGPGTYTVTLTDANGCETVTFGILFPPGDMSDFSLDVSKVCDYRDSLPFKSFSNGFLGDGLNDYLTLADTTFTRPGDLYTLEAWVRPTALAGVPQVVAEKRLLSNDGVSITYDPATQKVHTIHQNGPYFVRVESNASLQTGAWSHIALVVDSVYTKLYINGVLDSMAAFSGGTNPVPGTAWTFGGGPNRTSFVGMIDELRFWNVAMPPEEIQEIGHRPVPSAVNELDFYINFDQATGSNHVHDRSQHHLEANFVNADSEAVWVATNPLGLSYLWDFGDGTFNNSQNPTHNYAPMIFANSQVILRVSTLQGCTSRDTLMLPTHTQGNPFIQTSGSGPYCLGDTIGLFVSGQYSTYQWTNGSTNDSIWVTTTGNYGIDADDGVGCVHHDTLHITVFPNNTPAPIITPAGTTTLCDGDSVLIDVGSGYANYYWSNGATTQSIVVLDSGSYSVIVANGFGCTKLSDTAVVVVVPTPLATITAVGNVLTASPGTSYQWFFNGQPILGAINQTHTALQSGDYSVHVGNSGSCDAVSADFNFLVGLVGPATAGNWQLFPNPTTSDPRLNYELTRAVTLHLQIIDLQGRVLWHSQAKLAAGKGQLEIPMESLPSGAYLLKIDGPQVNTSHMISKM